MKKLLIFLLCLAAQAYAADSHAQDSGGGGNPFKPQAKPVQPAPVQAPPGGGAFTGPNGQINGRMGIPIPGQKQVSKFVGVLNGVRAYREDATTYRFDAGFEVNGDAANPVPPLPPLAPALSPSPATTH